jgi:hypothetical protein
MKKTLQRFNASTLQRATILIFFILLIDNLFGQNAFIPHYNVATNTFSIEINPCDECIVGGQDYVPYCKCASEADKYCLPNLGSYYNWCKYDYLSKTCSKYPKSPKVITSYNGGMTILYGTYNQSKSQYKYLYNPFSYSGPSLSLPNWNPSGPNFPNLSNGYNYCIYVHIAIFFSDGTFCHFSKEICVING